MGNMERLIEMLRNHDWYFDYSDDHRVWRRGVEERNQIRKEAERLGRPELVEQAFQEFEAGDLEWWLAELQEINDENEVPRGTS